MAYPLEQQYKKYSDYVIEAQSRGEQPLPIEQWRQQQLGAPAAAPIDPGQLPPVPDQPQPLAPAEGMGGPGGGMEGMMGGGMGGQKIPAEALIKALMASGRGAGNPGSGNQGSGIQMLMQMLGQMPGQGL